MSVAKKVAIGLIIVVGFGLMVANQVPKIEVMLRDPIALRGDAQGIISKGKWFCVDLSHDLKAPLP